MSLLLLPFGKNLTNANYTHVVFKNNLRACYAEKTTTLSLEYRETGLNFEIKRNKKNNFSENRRSN